MADLLTTKYHRLQQRNTIHQGFFRIEAYELQRIADQESLTRYVVQRPDATVILLYNQDEDCFYLVKQLRAPALQREPDPYLLELPAGVLEPGEEEAWLRGDPDEAAAGKKPGLPFHNRSL